MIRSRSRCESPRLSSSCPCWRCLLSLLASAAFVWHADAGQDTQQPLADRPDARTNPLLTDRSLDESMLNRIGKPANKTVVLPTTAPRVDQVVPNQPDNPTLTRLADGSTIVNPPNVLLSEGTFLAGRIGQIVRLETGNLAFLPAVEEGKPPLPAMALLPSETYAKLEALLDSFDGSLWMSLTGEVMTYHNRNYILPTTFSSVADPTRSTAAQHADTSTRQDQPSNQIPTRPDAAAGSADASNQPAENAVSDPRIDALVQALKAQQHEPKSLDTTFSQAHSKTPNDNTLPARGANGSLILNQTGRMVRTPGGSWAVQIDNDTDTLATATESNEQTPVAKATTQYLLLPCKTVQAMEFQAQQLGDRWVFQVSGNVYRMNNQMYLLPRFFVTLPPSEIDPLQ